MELIAIHGALINPTAATIQGSISGTTLTVSRSIFRNFSDWPSAIWNRFG